MDELENDLDWEEYFLSMAEIVRAKSRDRQKRVGAVVVGEGNCVLSTGYNGPARGVLDLEERISSSEPAESQVAGSKAKSANGAKEVTDSDSREEDGRLREKLLWICHAEANAVFNAARKGIVLNGATMYVTLFPCVGCAGAIVQSGITRVVTYSKRF